MFMFQDFYIFSLYGLSAAGFGFWVLDVVNLLRMLLIRGSLASDVAGAGASFILSS